MWVVDILRRHTEISVRETAPAYWMLDLLWLVLVDGLKDFRDMPLLPDLRPSPQSPSPRASPLEHGSGAADAVVASPCSRKRRLTAR